MHLRQEKSILKALRDLNTKIESSGKKCIGSENYVLIKEEYKKLESLINNFEKCGE